VSGAWYCWVSLRLRFVQPNLRYHPIMWVGLVFFQPNKSVGCMVLLGFTPLALRSTQPTVSSNLVGWVGVFPTQQSCNIVGYHAASPRCALGGRCLQILLGFATALPNLRLRSTQPIIWV